MTETYVVEALSRDALEDPWPFEFDGETYYLPNDFDIRAAACLATGELFAGMRLLLGEDQWDRVCKSPRIFTAKAMVNLVNAYSAAIGADLGELQASSDSSPSTATRSKPTSNGTTTSPSPTSSLVPSG